MSRWIPALLLLLALTPLTACDGGGGSGGGTAAGTGSVGVVVTDGPIDPGTFSEILVTVTEIVLIGDAGQHTIFESRRGRTIDLRELEDVGKLITLGRRVPAGRISKIRLRIAALELVPAEGGPSIFPKLPPKIDLVPRRPIHVRPGRLLLLQLDLDAEKSIHIVETGSGTVIFRPVIFIDVIEGPFPGKLVLLEGTVRRLDREGGALLLCDTHPVSRPVDGRRETLEAGDRFDAEDPEQREDFCVAIGVDDATSIFDEAGDPADLDVLDTGELATVLGRFAPDAERLRLRAFVLQEGRATAIDGVVLNEVVDGAFDLSVSVGQLFAPEALLPVELQDGARIFSRRGRELDEAAIRPGMRARAVGVLARDADGRFLKSSVVVLDLARLHGVRVFGEIAGIRGEGARIVLRTRNGGNCANVSPDARVFRVVIDRDGGMLEEIERSDLEVGDVVGVFGNPGGADDCIDAEKVIVFAGGIDD